MLMLALAAAAAAAPTPTPTPDQARFNACADLAAADPVKALDAAGAWRLAGGGIPARQCEGLAYVAQNRWIAAAAAFEAAARSAEASGDGRAVNLWVQAGNAALAGGDAAKARNAFDAAIARGVIAGIDLGELHVDRARARFAAGDKAGARTDLDTALKLVPADPLAWLLSATLARQAGDLARAKTDIAEALRRSSDDAQVQLEAGNIAMVSGSEGDARAAWAQAAKIAPTSPAGKAAADNLARLGATP